MLRNFLVLTALGFLGVVMPTIHADDLRRLKSEQFDREPGWDAVNNRSPNKKPTIVVQDFGYSRTNLAGGESPGEIGGKVVRSSRSSYYVKPLSKPASFEDRLRCSGKFVVTETGGTSTIHFGWFNSQTIGNGSYPSDSINLRFNGEAKGVDLVAGYTTSKYESEGGRITGFGPGGQKARDFNLIPVNTVYTFDIRYDPNGNNGSGCVLVSLGGEGPYTVKDVVINVYPQFRKSGARFDCFGIINAKAEPGGTLAVFFDDLVLNDELLTFDEDPQWKAQNNRAKYGDDFKRGEHDFGYQPDTDFAGGQSGEIGGRLFSDNAGYYGDDVGTLTLNDRLVASGRLALMERASEAGFYLGWVNSQGRGYPPRNFVGVFIEGPNSVGSMFRPAYASSDPKSATIRKEGPLVPSTGKRFQWKIEYDPKAADGNGEVKATLGDETVTLPLTPEARQQNAQLDRFGLAVYEGGGQWSTVYLDDLEYTVNSGK